VLTVERQSCDSTIEPGLTKHRIVLWTAWATMNFRNSTPFPAFLHREAISGDRIAAAAILRVTFDIATPCKPSRAQPWKVSPTTWEGPSGPMEPDAVFDREGCDLLLLGSATSPDGKPVRTVDVAVTVAGFSASVRVFGDRTWMRQDDRLVPSEAQPFTSMPLGLDRAYGGIATFDELKVPHPDNPRGKGYYLEEEEAEGASLPNIEDPDTLIRAWQERPEPVGVGFCPVGFGPRARRAAVVRDGRVVGVRRCIHNVAFPRFDCPKVEPGARIQVKGMGPDLEFDVPNETILAKVRVGETEHVDPPRIDQIGIEPERRRFFVTYRYTFIYPLRRGELRSCEVFWRGANAGEAPASVMGASHG
jgi:hypothetical protein